MKCMKKPVIDGLRFTIFYGEPILTSFYGEARSLNRIHVSVFQAKHLIY